jgi:hypothetical protein
VARTFAQSQENGNPRTAVLTSSRKRVLPVTLKTTSVSRPTPTANYFLNRTIIGFLCISEVMYNERFDRENTVLKETPTHSRQRSPRLHQRTTYTPKIEMFITVTALHHLMTACDLCNSDEKVTEGTVSTGSSGGVVQLCDSCWERLDRPRCSLCGTPELSGEYSVTSNDTETRGGPVCSGCRDILDFNHL